MADNQWFESWFDTAYYHLLYEQRDMEEASTFIRKLIGHLNLSPKATVCDLACGNGRHSEVVSNLGYPIVGLDLSPNNIELARRRELPDAEFYVHDMRKPFRNQHFDVVLNLFTSFGYFETHGEHDQTIQNMSQSLRSGGQLVIDFMNAIRVSSELVPESKYEKEGVKFEVQRKFEDGYITKQIHISEGKKEIHFEERVRAYHLQDFEEMLHSAGMRIEEVFGSYDLGAYSTDDSSRLIIKATKQ